MARFTYIPNRVIDTDGISDGANIYFYATGTTTPITVYSDAALTTPVSNPYPVAAGAAVPALYYSDADIRVRVVDSGGSVVSDDDPWAATYADAVGTDLGDTLQEVLDGYATRTALKAAASYAGARAYLTEAGREGMFVFRAADYSTEVAADTQEGIYIKADDTAATSGAWVRVIDSAINVEWFGAVGDDSTDNATALTTALAVAALAERDLLLPEGVFQVDTAVTIPSGGVVMRGQGYGSAIKAGANNINLLSAASGGRIDLSNLRLVGDETSSSSANGSGLYLTSFTALNIDTLWGENFGFSTLFIPASATTRDQIVMRNINCRGGKNPNAGENADILIYGVVDKITIDGFDGVAAATTPVGAAIAVAQTAASREWSDITITNVRARGYGRKTISLANENPTNDFQSGKVRISNFDIRDSGNSAIKTKNLDFVQISNGYVENAETAGAENAGSGLQGAVFLNGGNNTEVSNVIVNTVATDGLRINGRAAGTADDIGRARHHISGLQVNDASGVGLYVSFGVSDLTVDGFVAMDCAAGIRVQQSTGNPAPGEITFNAPVIRNTTGNNAGIILLGLTGDTIGRMTVNSPDIRSSGGFGIQAQYVDYLEVNGGRILDNGQNAVNTRGMDIADIGEIKIVNVTSKNDAGSTQTYGMRLVNTITNALIANNDFSGNATSGVLYSTAPTNIEAHGNRGWLTGSKTYDVPSIADGADDQTTVTVVGAAMGDIAIASLSTSLSNIQITAKVTSADTVGVGFSNHSGGAVDPTSGTLKVKVLKVAA